RFPRQELDNEFGQPPLNVYVNERFSIEVLFWLDGTPAIHEHAFAGAFHVLAGASIHSQYAFDLHERVSRRLLLGDLRLRGVEQLGQGDTRPIRPGPQFIHAVFHLDRPSVTVVVRTPSKKELLPQYSYCKPSAAYAHFELGEQMTRQLQLLAMLRDI